MCGFLHTCAINQMKMIAKRASEEYEVDVKSIQTSEELDKRNRNGWYVRKKRNYWVFPWNTADIYSVTLSRKNNEIDGKMWCIWNYDYHRTKE